MTEITHPPAFGEQKNMLIAFNNLQRQSMLWKLEETARHLGHADIIGEAIDGAVGVNPDHEARRRAAAMLIREELR